jgi:peptide/nickel transport system substrate-binding protein
LDRRAEVAFDRVEWRVISDDGTAAAALQAGEVDWWELPTNDLAPALQRAGHIRMEVTDKTGVIGLLKMNCLQPPFDKAAIRRALLGVVAQRDYVTAIVRGAKPGARRCSNHRQPAAVWQFSAIVA